MFPEVLARRRTRTAAAAAAAAAGVAGVAGAAAGLIARPMINQQHTAFVLDPYILPFR